MWWCINATAAWKKLGFLLSDISDFHIIDSLSIAVHTFARRIMTSLSVDDTLLAKYVKLSTYFGWLPFRGGDGSLIKTHTLFCLRSCRDQCLLLPIPGYATGIWLGLVCLQEEPFYLLLFLWDIVCFLPFWVLNHFLLLDLSTFKVHSLGRL